MKVRATRKNMAVRLLVRGEAVFVTYDKPIEVNVEDKNVLSQVQEMMRLGWLEEVKEEIKEEIKEESFIAKKERTIKRKK